MTTWAMRMAHTRALTMTKVKVVTPPPPLLPFILLYLAATALIGVIVAGVL